MATQTIIPPPKRRRGAVMRSPRSYLQEIRDYRKAVDRGQISSADGQRRVAMVQAELEAWCSLKVLDLNDQAHPIDVAPGPDEDYQPPQVRAHRVKKIAVKEGVGRHGERISEKQVSISSSSPGDDPEIDAEIEALT